ncbi:MAG: diguanylate cyclase [Firmicutes bacterium]|nr:diguanylate cyclase [Bacillota bacterium]
MNNHFCKEKQHIDIEMNKLISRLEQAEQDLHRAHTILDTLTEQLVYQDTNQRVQWLNKAAADSLGKNAKDLVGQHCFRLWKGRSKPCVNCPVKKAMETTKPQQMEITSPDDNVWFIKGYPIINETGTVIGGIQIIQEITGQVQALDAIHRNKKELVAINEELVAMNDQLMSSEAELRQQRAYFQQLFENSPEAIVLLDNTDRVIDVNKGFEHLFQYTKGESTSQFINDLIAPEHLIEDAQEKSQAVLSGNSIDGETIRKRKDGKLLHISLLAYPIMLNNHQMGIYAIYRDITRRKQTEEKLKFLSLHDPLTGLFNRTYFNQQLENLELNSLFPTGVIICDVDGLKLVNDALGHRIGDKLLIAAASVIRKCFDKEYVVARIGGDEFAIILPNSIGSDIETAAQRIREEVTVYNTNNSDLLLSMSVGYAVSDQPPHDIAVLFKEADNNMYREKLHRSQSARSAVVNTLKKALEARDYITEGHADRLQNLVVAMAEKMALPERSICDLRLLAQFHDIGKVGIQDRILFKPGPLTDEEMSEMKKHSEIGHRIALSAPDLAPIAQWILKHHEWWNGSGYPLGLKGDNIPLECRILSIADAYDAMTSNRPYRQAMTSEQAIYELRKCSGTQFDPQLVEIFIEKIENNGL